MKIIKQLNLILLSLVIIYICINPFILQAKEIKIDNPIVNFNSLEPEVAKDIISSTPEINNIEIQKFQIKNNTKQLFNFESYENIGIVKDVKEYLEIHEKEDTQSKIVGKLPLNGGCIILNSKDKFTQIKSGNISGYVESKYLATNKEALLKAFEITYELADITEDTFLYSNMIEDEKFKIEEIKKGSRFLIESKTLDWIKLKIDEDKTGYIMKNHISIIPELKMAEEVPEDESEPTRVVVANNSIKSNYSYGGYNTGVVSGAEPGTLRYELVNYALSFVGNPYVYGGTNPYTGIDCSAFVQYVYAQFGYKLPRTTGDQWIWAKNNGLVISPSEAQAGDLVLYDEHVAMLTGNGNQIVHASNSAPYPQGGIKLTDNYKYRSILGIVRIIN